MLVNDVKKYVDLKSIILLVQENTPFSNVPYRIDLFYG